MFCPCRTSSRRQYCLPFSIIMYKLSFFCPFIFKCWFYKTPNKLIYFRDLLCFHLLWAEFLVGAPIRLIAKHPSDLRLLCILAYWIRSVIKPRLYSSGTKRCHGALFSLQNCYRYIYIPKHVPFANKFCFSNAYCTFAAMSLETHTLSLYH